jgi:myo-inositol 2-dehydrogenase / D-chiro-inositol 1-dehydrogenase
MIPSLEYLRASGGFYRDKCVHFFDLARWILGEDPIEVVAMGTVVGDRLFEEADDVDTAAISLRFPSGALCQIDNARRAVHGYDDRFEVFGTGGMIEACRVRQGNVVRALGESSVLDPLPDSAFVRYDASYRAAIDAFGDFVVGADQSVPSLEDGLMAQIIAEAATVSAADRRIVTIAEIQESL